MRFKETSLRRTVLFSIILAAGVVCGNGALRADDAAVLQKQKNALKTVMDEAYNRRNLGVLDEYYDPGFVLYTNGKPAPVTGPVVLKNFITALTAEMPDFKLIYDDLVAEGNFVAYRWKVVGTHQKYNKPLEVHGIFLCRFDKGRIVEGWRVSDELSVFKQLGFDVKLTPPAP